VFNRSKIEEFQRKRHPDKFAVIIGYQRSAGLLKLRNSFMVIHVYFLSVELLARVHLNVTDILCNGVDKGFMAKRFLTGMTVTLKCATRS
jgi:hypothetical protein